CWQLIPGNGVVYGRGQLLDSPALRRAGFEKVLEAPLALDRLNAFHADGCALDVSASPHQKRLQRSSRANVTLARRSQRAGPMPDTRKWIANCLPRVEYRQRDGNLAEVQLVNQAVCRLASHVPEQRLAGLFPTIGLHLI